MSEASNIVHRFLRVAEGLDAGLLPDLRKVARTLDPVDLRKLAREVGDMHSRIPLSERHVSIVPGVHRPPQSTGADVELRGIARSIIRYGGPDAVLRDAHPQLIAQIKRIAWS